MGVFNVRAPYEPAGGQPAAIEALSDAVAQDASRMCLLGITGSGKSATIAWTIERANRPTLVLAPNKTLAAQLHAELSMLLPDNAVEYFVSYYDYYQPEAYVTASDTFIEKESTINEAIDRMRHAATSSALMRRDVVVVASVSAIYGLGAPEEYRKQLVALVTGETCDRERLLADLVAIGYDRNDVALDRGRFRVRGDVIDIFPAGEETVVRVCLFDDLIDRIERRDPVTGTTVEVFDAAFVYPATHYVASAEQMAAALESIELELNGRCTELREAGLLLEAQRLEQRTRRDLDLLRETGRCPGVENYSRHFDGRSAGDPPFTLLDYFGDNLMVVLDESHVLIPQLSAQQAGDRSRKQNLIDHGFRLPSALDNRPLSSAEFWEKVDTCIMVSATPGPYEREHATHTVELLVRPTGIVDPPVEVRPADGAVADFVATAEAVIADNGRVLVTVLTKKMAEELVGYLSEHNIRARYMHADTETLERIALLRDLRLGVFDVLVGINLLREGLDLPEVTLVAVFDADREGFLRSATSLIQTIGRAARNVDGRVLLYADKVTPAMRAAIEETDRRRAIQVAHNAANGIVPRSIEKAVSSGTSTSVEQTPAVGSSGASDRDRSADELRAAVAEAEASMLAAADRLEFEAAARWRDQLQYLHSLLAAR